MMPPIHPGEVLRSEFLDPAGQTGYNLAKQIGVPPMWIYNLLRGARGIDEALATRLSNYYGNSVAFWLNLQDHYEKESRGDANVKNK